MRFLVHVVCGEDSPTRSALGLLVALSALDEGHEVSVFMAGDGAGLARESSAAATHGIGTGNAGEHLTKLRERGVTIYVSKMSAQARGISPEDLAAAGYIPAPPTKLVELAADADRTLIY